MDRNRVWTEMENNKVQTEMGKLQTETECGGKRRTKDRSGDAGNGSEGRKC